WCRGVTTLPVDGNAQALDIMIPCARPGCVVEKFYRGENRYAHHDQNFCRDCGIKARRKPRKPGPAVLPKDPSRVVTVTCVGYPLYNARKARHKCKPPYQTKKPRRRL